LAGAAEWAWLGQEAWRAPQKAAAGLGSIILLVCTCIILDSADRIGNQFKVFLL
jgi:hypothetical protein